jgi:predicted nucleic acid-binding protein
VAVSGKDIVALSTGPGFVCLDAMVLIHFNRVGSLKVLRDWLGPRVFTANVITEQELRRGLPCHPENKAILDSEWLFPVPVDGIEDIALVASLRRRWGSQDDQDRGEAEVVALCARYGWTAVMDDEVGRKAAKERGAPCVYMLTMVDEVREVGDMARWIAAILLLQPELDRNYLAVKGNTYPWQKAT